jgi:DNA-binding SARP family transcriptional activator
VPENPPTSSLTVQLLGGFRLTDANGSVSALDSLRVQSLLAYLVLHPGPQPRQRLAALFWPESPEGQARTNLRKLVLELRRGLPDSERHVLIDDRTLQWCGDAAVRLDVAEFERALAGASSAASLEGVIGLYRGDLLPDCYEDWIIPQRERLRQAFMEALERLVAALEAQRNYAAAIRYARRLLDLDPLQEGTVRLLMRLHALTGDRTGAVRVYHACATALQRELGTAPSQETREAYERLLAVVHARPAAQPLAAPPLVGRHAEWDRLQAAWRTAAAGQPRVVLLRGEAGVGKSRLAEDLAEWAVRQGIAVRQARCYAAEGGLAYAPITTLLRARPLQPPTSAAKRELARLLPELLDDPALAPPGPLSEVWQRQHLFETVAHALLAVQPLLVVLDDVHWCDEESLEFFHYLSRCDRHARLLLLGTLRPDDLEPAHPLQRVLTSWRHAGVVDEIDVPPLDAGFTERLAASVVGAELDPRAAARVYRDTGGNPLFVVELARAGLIGADGGSRLPAQIQEVIRTRLQRLSPPARDLAGVAAVVGRSFTFALLAEVTGMEEDALIRCLDELWQRRIIREHGAEAYDFSHDMLREVAYAGMSGTRRRWLHRQVARALETLRADEHDASGQIAMHYEQAGLLDRAVPEYVRAADAARRVYAYDAAINYYHRLLAVDAGVDRILVMRHIGEIWQQTGRWTDAEQMYRQALSAAVEAGSAEAQAECQTRLGFILRLRGLYDEAGTWFERARAAFEQLDLARGISRATGHLGVVHFERADYARALACFERQRQIAERLGDTAELSNALRDTGLVHWARGDYALALEAHQRHLRLAAERGEQSGVEGMNALNNLGLVYRSMGDYARALEYHHRSLDIARKIGHRRGIAVALGNVAIDSEEQGAYVHALAHLTQQLEIAVELGDPRGRGHAAWHIGNVYEALGDYEVALQCFSAQLRIGMEITDRRMVAMALANIARVYVAQDRRRDAERLYGRSLALLDAAGVPHHQCEVRYRLAAFYAGEGRYREALEAAADALEVAASLKRAPIRFAAELLSVHVRLRSGEITSDRAREDLLGLLARCEEPRQQAAVRYDLWRVTGADEHRRIAGDLYRRLSAEVQRVEYRRRFEELAGERPPEAPPLPPLPGELTGRPIDLEEVLARVDRFLAQPAPSS